MKALLCRITTSIQRRFQSFPLMTYCDAWKMRRRALDLSPAEQTLAKRVSTQISRIDDMYGMYGGSVYFYSAITILRCIRRAQKQAGIQSVNSLLDFPSGFGRLGRFWPEVYPQTKVTSCDIQKEAVDFCARVFGSRPCVSHENFDEIQLGQTYDLIFCGSLISHLNEERTESLLRCFYRHLNQGGLVVFTIHGDENFERYRLGQGGLDNETERRMADEYMKTGFSFRDPAGYGYGTSLSAPHWIREAMGRCGKWREVYFCEGGWMNYQDVFGFVRVDENANTIL